MPLFVMSLFTSLTLRETMQYIPKLVHRQSYVITFSVALSAMPGLRLRIPTSRNHKIQPLGSRKSPSSPSVSSRHSTPEFRKSLSTFFSTSSEVSFRRSEDTINVQRKPSGEDRLKGRIETFCHESFGGGGQMSRPSPIRLDSPTRKGKSRAKGEIPAPSPFTISEITNTDGSASSKRRVFEIMAPLASGLPIQERRQFALTIPSNPYVNPRSTALHMRYVAAFYPSIPVPNVMNADSTRQNPLEKPYLLTSLLPGHRTSAQSYNQLPFDTKCSIAVQMGNIYRALFYRKVGNAGLLAEASDDRVLSATHDKAGPSFRIKPFPVRLVNLRGDAETRSGKQCHYDSVLAWLEGQFARFEAAAVARSLPVEVANLYAKLRVMARDVEKAGLLGGEAGFGVVNNALSESSDDLLLWEGRDGRMAIGGVVGWEDMRCLPLVAGAVYPTWLWGGSWNEGSLGDEVEEALEVKGHFERAVGGEWTELANPRFDVARELCAVAERGLQSWEIERGWRVLENWSKIRPAAPGIIDGLTEAEDVVTDEPLAWSLPSIKRREYGDLSEVLNIQ